MAKLLVDLDRDLVDTAQTILGEPSLAATIRTALRRVVQQAAFDDMLDYYKNLDDEQRTALAQARDQW